MKNKLNCVLALVLCSAAIAAGQATSNAPAQTAPNSQSSMDQNIQLLRLDIRSKKKQMVAANLNLTDAEATKFWPIYDQYTADLVKINDEKYALIKEYADSWGTMTDDQALSLTKRALGSGAERRRPANSLCAALQQGVIGQEGGHVLSNRTAPSGSD